MRTTERHRISRATLHDSFTQPYYSVVKTKPLSVQTFKPIQKPVQLSKIGIVKQVVDDIEDDNEEEEYEEMEDEEEDDDDVSLDSTTSLPGLEEVICAMSDRASSTSSQCLVCGRTSSPKTRLFKWPEDLQLRKSWSMFFRLSLDYLNNCKDPYICSIHFDADQFLYEGHRIFWKRNSSPRFRHRRSLLAEPLPWELEQNVMKKVPIQTSRPVRQKHGWAHGHTVTFRESYFKSKSKSSHPVAVVSLPDNPDVFYEFSYTRTSPIDSSKFYSCLTCRRAKMDTRVKDVIRTIHIKDGKIRSRCDPFWGHHFACRPFTAVKMSNSTYRIDSQLYEECMEPKVSDNDRQCYKESYSEKDVKAIPSLGMSATSELCRMEAPQSSSQEQKCRVNLPSAVRTPKLCYMQQQRSARSLPHCHICRRVLSSTQLLVQHLLQHMKSAPNCRCCGSKMSPDEHVRLLRIKTCSLCIKNVSKKCISKEP